MKHNQKINQTHRLLKDPFIHRIDSYFSNRGDQLRIAHPNSPLDLIGRTPNGNSLGIVFIRCQNPSTLVKDKAITKAMTAIETAPERTERNLIITNGIFIEWARMQINQVYKSGYISLYDRIDINNLTTAHHQSGPTLASSYANVITGISQAADLSISLLTSLSTSDSLSASTSVSLSTAALSASASRSTSVSRSQSRSVSQAIITKYQTAKRVVNSILSNIRSQNRSKSRATNSDEIQSLDSLAQSYCAPLKRYNSISNRIDQELACVYPAPAPSSGSTYCPRCGYRCSIHDNFCMHCGQILR